MQIIKKCSDREVMKHIKYLKGTHVANLTKLLVSGDYILKKANIDNIEELGNTKSFFRNLDIFWAMKIYKRDRFLVKEEYPILTNKKCNDPERIKSIKFFIRKFQKGKLKAKITIIDTADGLIICDGNKRTVALYEFLKTKQTLLALGVYLMTPSNIAFKVTL